MTWYSERIKGSNLQRHRHRVAATVSCISLGLGIIIYNYSPHAKLIRQSLKGGFFDPAPQMARREVRKAELFNEVVGTKKERDARTQELLEEGYEGKLLVPRTS